ncbi:carbohydrate ABC transporter permease [Cohnella silvisoli]|uniref:Sugar ABC transporter permease n=1 Tax=Cohnella silvisoli TaxID=2873699 RepID=A0ABV1L0T3_9BACL|nr:sugar ABC transporter permease [Cohnella silvisoli]MCD9025307.1 sugar ABC transporter permease [Cohnella silvisoli]
MKSFRIYLPAYLFLLPALSLFILFMFVPILSGLKLSFQRWSFDGAKWVGFSNYAKIFHDSVFWDSLRTTVVYTVFTVFFGIVISLIIAFLMDPIAGKLQSFFKAAYYLPSVAPIVIISVLWGWLYNPSFGLLNYLLEQIGLEPVLWLGDPNIALYSIIMMTLAVSQGPSILILVAALGGIPKDYQEAATIDGANGLQETFHIKLPLLKPALLYLAIVNTVGSFQVFAPIYMMTGGGPNGSTTTIGFLIYENGFKKFDFGVASAQAVILLILVMIIAVIQFKYLSNDVEY